jgi:hypothetical protein
MVTHEISKQIINMGHNKDEGLANSYLKILGISLNYK